MALSSPAREFEELLKQINTVVNVGLKLDLDNTPEPPREVLRDLQNHLNARMAAQLHSIVTPRGILDAMYFGYTDSSDVNAFAFQSRENNRAFIAVTIGLFKTLGEVTARLAQAEAVLERIGCQAGQSPSVYSAIFSVGAQVIADHELGHHFHGHTFRALNTAVVRSERTSAGGSTGADLSEQAMELEADGYAIWKLLRNAFLDGPRDAYARLLWSESESQKREALLIELCLLGTAAVHYSFLDPLVDKDSVVTFDHPPFSVRAHYVMEYAVRWMREEKGMQYSDDQALEDFRNRMAAIDAAIPKPTGPRDWYAQGAFLRSPDGIAYLKQLDEAVRELRHRQRPHAWHLT